jgi:translation initiation factor 2B subunit (eIF-2B alpha/beta/delta family)
MINPAITTAVKMLEALPEKAQNQVVEHMREYIATLRDEQQWDAQFQYTQTQLLKAARQARQQIAEGKAQPLDIDQL